LTLEWSQLAPGVDTPLVDTTALLRITNNSDSLEDVVVELVGVGDLGTTKSYTAEFETTQIGSDASVDVSIDLESMFPALDSTYSGYLHVVAKIATAEGQAEQVVSPGLYFHRDDDSVLVYDESALRNLHRGGDFDGLVAESVELVDEEEDRAIIRVVGYEDDGIGSAERSAEALDLSGPLDPLVPGQQSNDSIVQDSEPQASPYFQKLCVSHQVQTVDSGFANSVGIKEDLWQLANAGGTTVGYGVAVTVNGSPYTTDFLGCVIFSTGTPSLSTSVTVHAYATDANSNYIRLHNGASNSQDSYPGATYGILTLNVPFSTGVTTNLSVGNYSERWTAFAAMAHALWYYNVGVSDTEYHVSDLRGENPVSAPSCGANVNYFNDVTNSESYIALVTADDEYCPFHNQRNKFVLAHEYGHAYASQIASVAQQSPASTSHSATPSGSCSFGSGVGYDNNTKEWSSLAIREGFAHYVSARIWNNEASDGQFWWGTSFDLERWNSGNTEGGYLVNQCCPGTSMSCATSLDGAGVLTDWMRAFWDMHTDSTCSLDQADMPYLYGLTIGQGGLTNDNFYPTTHAVMAWWGSTCQDRWEFIGCHNGIDRQGAIWSGC